MPDAAYTPSNALTAARARLRAIAERLGAFLSGSEGAFLEAGTRLGDLDRRARGLVDVSRSAALGDAVRDADPGDALEEALGRLARLVESSRAASGAAVETLGRVEERTRAIGDARSAFTDVPRTLRVLGMNTRIENSRAGAQSAGMETVVAEVRRLGDLVEPRFQAMFDETARLHESAAEARATAARFLEGERAWSPALARTTGEALAALRALAEDGTAVAARAGTTSEAVVRSVAEVLVALQAHDATRQMLEHVVEELTAFEADAAAGEDAHPETWLAEVARLCPVLAAQVRGARERVAAALDRIAEALRTVAARVAALGEDTARLAGAGADRSPLEEVRRGVEQARRALAEHLAHEEETAAAMARVAETLEGIAASVREVQGIGRAVKIIALNALVETERIGAGGRVLAVLAQAIGVLASDVVRRTGEVSASLGAVARAAGDLRARPAAAPEDGADVGQALAALLERLGSRHAQLRGSAEALHQGSDALRAEVDDLARTLARGAGEARDLARLEEELDRAGAEAAREAGSEVKASGPVRRSRADTRYTMEAERAIDRAARAGAPATPAAEAGASAELEPLGDNVELF